MAGSVIQGKVQQIVQGGQGLVSSFQEGYDALVKAIIRPPRAKYDSRALGAQRFIFAGVVYHRVDFDISSLRPGKPILKCSHFTPEPKEGKPKLRRPCVIFCHGNAASRVESLTVLKTVLAASSDLCALDFAGSGLSQGEYVSLGHFEKDDLAAVVQRLRSFDNISKIGLWGRSMGAVTALLHAVRDPSIAGMVVDSPFTSLRVLAGELCEKETYGAVPNWLADAALSVIKVSIQQRVDFDIDDLTPISHAASTRVPAMFAAAHEDDFIYPHHARDIQEVYGGASCLMMMEGDHNSDRPQYFLDEVRKFFMFVLYASDSASDFMAGRSDATDTGEFPDSGGDGVDATAPMPTPRFLYGADVDTDPTYCPIPQPEHDMSDDAIDTSPPRGGRSPRQPEPRREKEKHTKPRAVAESSERAPPQPPPTGKDAIRQQLMALGFSASQVDKAMVRNSTLEGCVEWLLTEGG